MKVQVAKWGNSTAVRLPKAVVDRLGLKPGSEVDITVEGAVAQLKPVKMRRPITLDEIVAEMKRLGGRDYDPGYEDWPDPVTDWPEYVEETEGMSDEDVKKPPIE